MTEKKLGKRFHWLGCECEVVQLIGQHSVKMRMVPQQTIGLTQPFSESDNNKIFYKVMPWPLPKEAKEIT